MKDIYFFISIFLLFGSGIGFAAYKSIDCKKPPYQLEKKCIKDSIWSKLDYGYGLSLRGKLEWGLGLHKHTKCLEFKMDTIKRK